jgi:hypothetical protein
MTDAYTKAAGIRPHSQVSKRMRRQESAQAKVAPAFKGQIEFGT